MGRAARQAETARVLSALESVRLALGWSRPALAREIGVSVGTVYRWYAGPRALHAAHLALLAGQLGRLRALCT